MPHRFSLGQSVTYTASLLEASGGSGRYTITQHLPAELGEYHYTIRREKTGELRRVTRDTAQTCAVPGSIAQIAGKAPSAPRGGASRRWRRVLTSTKRM